MASKWADIFKSLLRAKAAAADGPTVLTAPGGPAPYQPPPEDQPANPSPTSWQTMLRGQTQPQAQPEPAMATPVGDVWQHNKLVRNPGEVDEDYANRLGQSTPHGERSWQSVLRHGAGSIPEGVATLPTNNPRIRLGGGNYAGAAIGGGIRGILENLLSPNDEAEAFKQRELGQVRGNIKAKTDAAKAAADATESTARANYYNTQAAELPDTNRQKRESAATKNVVALVKNLPYYQRGENPDFDQQLADAGLVVADFDKRNGGKPVVSEVGGHSRVWDWEKNDWKDLGVSDRSKVPDQGGVLPGQRATIDAAEKRQARQIQARKDLELMHQTFNRNMETTRQGNRVALKQTPGAKATGSGAQANFPISYSQIYKNAEGITPPGSTEAQFHANLQKAFDSAKKQGQIFDDGFRPDALTEATPKVTP